MLADISAPALEKATNKVLQLVPTAKRLDTMVCRGNPLSGTNHLSSTFTTDTTKPDSGSTLLSHLTNGPAVLRILSTDAIHTTLFPAHWLRLTKLTLDLAYV